MEIENGTWCGLWKEVLDSKYGSWKSLDNQNEHNIESWWRRYIRKVCGKGTSNNWFNNNITWSRGDEDHIRFWKHNWM